MTFLIDTGIPDRSSDLRIDRRETAMDGVLDALPPDATEAQIDAAVIAMVLGELHKPALLETARAVLCRFWPLVAPIALRDPAAFDEVVVAYAELTTVLPFDRSEAIQRRNRAAADPRQTGERP